MQRHHQTIRRAALLCLLTALLSPLAAVAVADGDLEIVTSNLWARSSVPKPEVALNPALTVAPQRRTVLPGDTITFEALNETNQITWFLIDNFSGATISNASVNTMIYTAGANTGVVDIVQGWDGRNQFARSFVNVISTEEASKLGKAVIVAGGKRRDDPVWKATDYVAHKAFDVLRYRGYFPDNIQHLSFDPLVPNADGGATTDTVADTSQLFVYMANHGSSSSSGLGVFRLNAGQQLARDSMSSYQNATMDDNKDGVSDGADGAVAQAAFVGDSFIAGKDIPTIGTVLGADLLTAGTVASLWADDISSVYALNRVWCNVLAPSHAPNTNSATPVVDVPELELEYDLSAGRHASDYAGFSEQSTYKVPTTPKTSGRAYRCPNSAPSFRRARAKI